MKISATFSALATLASTAAATANIMANVSIALPTSHPPFAKLMDPAFASFSFEFQFWPTYAGNATNQPNQYVNQLLRNLGERTGKQPAVRVGGEHNVSLYEIWTSVP
jgi:hypothetical protein